MRSALIVVTTIAMSVLAAAVPARTHGPSQASSAGDTKETQNQKNDQASAKQRTAPASSDAAAQKKPRKVVVRQGGAKEPEAQIVTGMTPEEASRERQEAEKFLNSADENLRRLLGRALAAQQQEDVSQIHNYTAHAREALKEGDISRGHTLAMKANLLAEDLIQH